MHPIEDIRGGPTSPLYGKKVILAITGSIAAVETIKLARQLAREGAEVIPVLSEAGSKIIHPDAIWFATGNVPIMELTGDVEHVTYCGQRPDGVPRADALLIAPCTANTISKVALGIDDTAVTTFATTALGSGIPILIAPAMHSSMGKHPAVSENIEKLKEMGVTIIQPKVEENKDKLASNSLMVDQVIRVCSGAPLKDKNALILYGATSEPIDSMRVITNQSTGKTGKHLAHALYRLGCDVTVMRSNMLEDLEFARNIPFTTTSDIIAWLEELAQKGHQPDVIAVPAAISDFRPVKPEDGKIPSKKKNITIKLEVTPKVLDRVHELFPDSCVVAFKAESGITDEELIKRAAKRLKKTATMVIANNFEEVGPDHTRVIALSQDNEPVIIEGPKTEVGHKLALLITEVLE